MDVGATILAARRQAGLTQAELAERCGTSQATLSAYEHGRKRPSAETLDRILGAAGVRLAIEPASRPVLTPGPGRLERLARTLGEVVELAAELPSRHSPTLRYPRLPSPPGGAA
jgi:transcriptional regulator with XRE-family HTH domain